MEDRSAAKTPMDEAADADRARRLAEKLIDLARRLPADRGADMLQVSTAAFCRAMGQPQAARLEEVRAFVRLVAGFMAGQGVQIICGCGYLSMGLAPEGRIQAIWSRGQEPMATVVDDVAEAWSRLQRS